nr:autotransporter domain-containing protein [Sphingomonas laterariae]
MTSNCTGTSGPLLVDTAQSIVAVAQGAVIEASSGAGITTQNRGVTLRIDGIVTASGGAGISVQNGRPVYTPDPYAGAGGLDGAYVYPYLYPNAHTMIAVGATGTVSGNIGIELSQPSYNLRGGVFATIDNAGSITSSSGAAIRGAQSGPVYIGQLTNREGGFIGGVTAGLRTVNNQGTIDGGSDSALQMRRAVDPTFGSSSGTVSNEGAILSGGTAATIQSAHDSLSIINSGRIENSGAGNAIAAAGHLSLTNEATGTIATGGTLAIAADDIVLINRGTINGSVTATGSSRIDSSQGGTINGDVLLGAGDDVLVAAIDEQGLITTGVAGLIDGGAGRNRVEVAVREDATLKSAPALPLNFQLFGAALIDGAVLTLDADYVSTSALTVSGQGGLINEGRIATTGTAIGQGDFGLNDLTIVNRGTIEATLSDPTLAAIQGAIARQIENSGTITATGGMAIATGYDSQTIVNSGTIHSAGPLTIGLGGAAGIENLAGGVISGGGVAIGFHSADPYAYQAATVINAGRIDGDVDFTGRSSPNIFIQRNGGVVNGDIRLGAGDDLYVVEGSSGAQGLLAGLSGTLDGGDGLDRIVARFTEDTDATLGGASIVGIEQIAIDISEGKTLTLGGAIGGTGLGITGNGTADLSIDMNLVNSAAIDAISMPILLPGELPANGQDATTIISRGTIAASFNNVSYYSVAAVSLGYGDLFTNEGTIALTSVGDPVYGGHAAAVLGGASVVNTGTISLDGGIAISGARAIINDGTITQIDGGDQSFGVTGFETLANHGRISTGDVAVLASGYTASEITNTGTIESSDAEAIRHSGYASVRIVNVAGGVIKGAADGPAITSIGGATIENAGAIVGDVTIGGTDGFWYGGSTYIAAGGTIDGNLIFGSGYDVLLVEGDDAGVSGIIDGGDGFDLYGRSFRASADVSVGKALPVSFEGEAIEAATADTVLTLIGAAPAADRQITFHGAGKIVNTIDFGANSGGQGVISLGQSLRGDAPDALAFVNAADGAFRITGRARDFSNSGAISNVVADSTTVALVAAHGQDFTFDNRGTIAGAPLAGFGNSPTVTIYDDNEQGGFGATLANSGTIAGGMALAMRRSAVDFTNSGTLSTTPDANPTALELSNRSNENPAAIRIVNSGVIEAAGGTAVRVSSFGAATADSADAPTIEIVNTGRIVGNMVLSAYQVTMGQYGFPEYVARAVSIDNGGTIAGDVTLDNGGDRFVQRANAHLDGLVDGGAGTDLLVFELNGGVVAPDFTQFVNFEDYAVTGTGILSTGADLPFETLGLAGGSFTVASGSELRTSGAVTLRGREGDQTIVNDGAIAGAVETGAGNDSFTNNGTVGGAIDLGGGNDRYIASYAEMGGRVAGGDGNDTLSLRFAGTAQAPILFNPSAYSGFETFETMAGVAAIDGPLAFQSLLVSGGRVIGRVGSTISAPRIVVAPDGTFGSAGTVVGDIAVAGTLSPGASPGTMTVSGNVSLAAGSTSLFELTTSISDQLLISGTLAISDGATLALTGDRPLTPGTALDLIIADGGITGSFTSISQSSTFGFVRQTADRIQLLGQFLNAGLPRQTAASVDYVNAVLVAGQASPALLAALPLLLTPSGETNGAAFALLNAEAYASATQIGVEHGLTVAKAGRISFAQPRQAEGWFGFGQVLGNQRNLDGNAQADIAQADVDSYGLLGGIGHSSGPVSIGGFVGYLDGDQKIARLGASTDAGGVFAGVVGRYAEGAFSANLLISYEDGTAKTSRALPGQRTARADYGLSSWIADAAISYSFPVASHWALSPRMGFTYVSTRRGRATERDGGVFGLAVAATTLDATFLDGALDLQGTSGPVRPWASLGLRHQTSGRHSSAVASFTDVTEDFVSYGVTRGKTLATAGAGVAADIGNGVSLFSAYQGEFGDAGAGHNVNVGLRVGF